MTQSIHFRPALLAGALACLGLSAPAQAGNIAINATDNAPPAVVMMQPANGDSGVPVDQPIIVQFDRSMRSDCRVELKDWFEGPDLTGLVTWSQRVDSNDTLTFVPASPLRYAMTYTLSLDCYDATGIPVTGYNEGVDTFFSTAGAPDDDSAPQVTSTSPYAGQIGGTTSPIGILFDKPIDSATVNAQSVLLTGPGAPSVRFEPRGYLLTIWPQGLQAQALYQVTLTTAVADAEGHSLATAYSFSFNTGAGDTTPPEVVQTFPADQAPGLEWEPIRIFFSENMDPDNIDTATVRVFDQTAGDIPVAIHLFKDWVDEDGARAQMEIYRAVEEGGRWQSEHTYRVELDQAISDLAGNGLDTDYVFRFAVAGWPNTPPSLWLGDSRANRQPDGRVTVELAVGTWSTIGDGALDVDVVDLTQSGKHWDNLQQNSEEHEYVYLTPDGMDEALDSGLHELLITITDPSNSQTRTLLWSIYVFDAVPVLTGGPADGATNVSLQPGFSFATNGMTGAAYYWFVIMEETSGETVFSRVILPNAGTSYAVEIPPSQALESNTPYRWAAVAFDSIGWEVGLAVSDGHTFVTGSGMTNTHQLTVATAGTGLGTVTGPNIDCGSTCSASFDSGSSVTLTATPAAGATFAGWSGACAGTATTCTLTMNADQNVLADFSGAPAAQPPLAVTLVGQGLVASSPDGLNCRDLFCQAQFDAGTLLHLTATPVDGWRFVRWEGACTGTQNTCDLTLDVATTTVAVFEKVIAADQQPLAVIVVGNGRVDSTPVGIDCGTDCAEVYDANTSLTLTATPDQDGLFLGWGGACSGTASTCQLTLSEARLAVAAFSGFVVDRGVSAWKIAEIYMATLGYAPDDEGLQYWINNIDTQSQWTPETVAQSFFDQPLVAAMYPESAGYGPFIEALYRNIFGRSADSQGYDYWLAQLESGTVTRNQMIIAMINGGWGNSSPEAQSDMLRFTHRVEVALAFSAYQAEHGIRYSALSEPDQAYLRRVGRDVLLNVTAEAATRNTAIDSLATLLVPLH